MFEFLLLILVGDNLEDSHESYINNKLANCFLLRFNSVNDISISLGKDFLHNSVVINFFLTNNNIPSPPSF